MSDQLKPREFKRVILQDAPSEIDEFSGGGHLRTASALADAIFQFEDQDHAVGLEGSWGSGKSTIVGLAEKKLREIDAKHKHHVFTFDLWANQTGHFKRAFLEAFLSWSTCEFPAQNDFLRKKKKEVGDRKQTITTEHTPKFSCFGIAAIIFLYFTPLIYAWLTPGVFADDNGSSVFPIGAKLALMAIGVMTLILLFAIAGYWPDHGSKREKLRTAFSKTFGLFSKEAEVQTIEQNVRDEDPTKYEFTKIFREIIARLQKRNDRIVVVFDNIDRLPTDRIADQWAEVRSAFYGVHASSSDNAAITAIVPYARTIALPAVLEESDSKTDYLEADLFRKSFDAIFQVSPPILSDAASFFKHKFRKATKGQITDQESDRVYRVFDLQVQKTERPVTPRQVIAFINDVTGWWVQWQNKIPIETIAVFVAHQEQLVTNPSLLRKKGEVDERMMQHAAQANIVRDLAALAYNVEPKMAFQVLNHGAIAKALIADKPDGLLELVDGAPNNGFEEILPEVIYKSAREWSRQPHRELANAVANVAIVAEKSDLFEYSKSVLISSVDSLAKSAIKDIERDEKLWKLLSLAPSDAANSICTKLLAWVEASVPIGEANELESGSSWIKAVGRLFDSLKDHHGEAIFQAVISTTRLPRGPKALIGAAYDCDQTEYHIRQFASITSQKDEIANALEEFVEEAEVFQFAWPELAHLFGEPEKSKLLNLAIDYLKANILDGGSDELSWSIENVWQIYSALTPTEREKNTSITEFFNCGAAVSHGYALHRVKRGDTSEDLAKLFWLFLDKFGLDSPKIANAHQVAVFGNIQPALDWFVGELNSDEFPDARAKKIAELSLEVGHADQFFQAAVREPEEQNKFKVVLNHLLSSPNLSVPKFSIFADNFEKLQELLDERFDTLLAKVGSIETDEFWAGFCWADLAPELLNTAVKRNEPGWKILKSKLDDWLIELDAPAWKDALADNSNVINLLALRNEHGSIEISSTHLQEPLMTNALSILSGEHKSSIANDTYSRLVGSLPLNTRAQFAADIFKRHNVHSAGIAAALSSIENIVAAMPFESDPAKAIDSFLRPLLELATPKADQFVETNGAAFTKVLKKADPSKSGLIEEYLAGLGEDEEASARANSLRKALGLKAKKKKKTDDSPKDE